MVCPASDGCEPASPMEAPVAVKVKKVKAKPPKEVMLGICGGVGPAAGLLLHQLILENTDSAGEDQGHLNVCHFSRSEDMTDRTEYLVYAASSAADATDSDSDCGSTSGEAPYDSSDSVKEVENPACGMARTFAMMHAAATAGRARLVVGVPCNTFHAQPIWDEFIRRTGSASCVQHVHMLEETVSFIARKLPSCRRVGLMSTTGTRHSRVYHDLLEPRGYSVIEVNAGAMQQELHESIYSRDWGVKSTAPAVSPRAETNFHRYALQLRDQGAEVILLGCTEIPFVFAGQTHLAGILLIDPMVALARAMIREADPSRLKHADSSTTAKNVSSIYPVMPLSAPMAWPVALAPLKCAGMAGSSATAQPSGTPRANCS